MCRIADGRRQRVGCMVGLGRSIEREQLPDHVLHLGFVGTASADEITQASHRIGEVIALLDEKELRWLELDELINP